LLIVISFQVTMKLISHFYKESSKSGIVNLLFVWTYEEVLSKIFNILKDPVSLWLTALCWTKSLLCNDAFKQGFSYFQSLLIQSYTSRRFCSDSKSEKSDPLHSSRRLDILSGCLAVKASSVWTTRTFRLDFPLCSKASNYSRLHLSRRLSNTAGRLSVFDKSEDFFPKYRYGKTAATARTLLLIRQVVHTKFNRPDINLHGPNAQVLIWKLYATEVQPSGRQSPWSERSSLNMEIACSLIN
jgi:hypothetical protein